MALYDDRLDHPAWAALRFADRDARAAIRASYFQELEAASPNGEFLEEMALNVTIARKPGI